MRREFAIIVNSNSNVENIIKALPSGIKTKVFFKYGDKKDIKDIECIEIPESFDTEPKRRNYILKSYRDSADNNMFLHLISDSVTIEKDPTEFLNELEALMLQFDINSWFGTVCDPCNYVYSKYNPRLRLTFKTPTFQKSAIDEILFTSHSNTAWTAYNIATCNDNELYLPEDYKIAMYYIIEYLANRRNTKTTGQLYYMNQYPTVKSEKGVYKTISQTDKSEKLDYDSEDKVFKAKNINFAPDNNIDCIIDDVYNILKKKAIINDNN